MTYLWLILSVVIGIFLAQWFTKKNGKLLLVFSGSYLLAITLTHLLPEVFEPQETFLPVGIWVCVGVLIQILLEFSSRGIEHGHVHFHGKLGWGMLVGLFAHAILEGTVIQHSHGPLISGIIIHKIPVAMVLFVALTQLKISTFKKYGVMFLFAICSPIGVWLASLHFLDDFKLPFMAIVAGIFLHVSAAILFESAENHQYNLKKVIVILVGFLLGILLLLLEH